VSQAGTAGGGLEIEILGPPRPGHLAGQRRLAALPRTVDP
jgi:hypothetical protein